MSDEKEPIRLMTPVGRLINHSLFEKDVFTDKLGREAVPSYKVEIAFDPAEMEEFENAVVSAAVEKWGEGAEQDYDDNKIRSPVIDGDELAKARVERGKSGEAYEGKIVVRAKTIFNRNGEDGPGGVYVCGPDAKELDFAEHGSIYNGCYGQASVTLNAYDGIAGGQDGVGLYLNGFQLVREGERLRGADPSSLFSPMMGKDSDKKGRRTRGKK